MFAHGNKRRTVLKEREYDGYFYSLSNKRGNTLYLQCKQRRTHTCAGTGTIKDGHFAGGRPHNHARNPNLALKYWFENALYTATTSSQESCKTIYDRVCAANLSGGALVPFETVRDKMKSWQRKNVCPHTPQTWEEYGRIVQMEEWRSIITAHANGNMTVTALRCPDKSTVVVFADTDFLTTILSEFLCIDATFKVCPRIPKIQQLLTIMAEVDGVMLPIAWALMERNNDEAYLVVLRYFHEELALHITPTSIMTDFEIALSQALQTVYPAATARPCFFHYCQALLRKVKKLHLMTVIEESEVCRQLFQDITALALLPSDDIVDAFDWILGNLDPQVAGRLEPFLRYVGDHWIAMITPQAFSVFGLETRTNNYIEAYHRVLQQRMGVHPRVWEFTEHLRQFLVFTRGSRVPQDFALSIKRNASINQRSQDATLQQTWQLYKQHRLDIPGFLAWANRFLEPFNRHNLIMEDEVDDIVVDLDVAAVAADASL